METRYVVQDESGKYYGRYSKLEYAKENAEIEANEQNKDMFIQKVTVEVIECIIPN